LTTQPEPFSYRSQGTTERVVEGKRVPAKKRSAEVQALVDEWNANNPEIATPFGRENLARGRGVDFASIAVMRGEVINDDGTAYTFEQMWRDRFDKDPDLMWLLVGDIVRYVSADEIPRGTRTSSRRQVQDKDRNLASVWRIIGTSYSIDPFPVAVVELIGERSLRAFAGRCGFGSVETLRRYMRGQRPLTMDALESCANAGRVEPFYFVEYRAMWLGRELQRAMLSRPNESVRAVRQVKDSVI